MILLHGRFRLFGQRFLVLAELCVRLVLVRKVLVQLAEQQLTESFERDNLALDLLVLLERFEQAVLGVQKRVLAIVDIVEDADGHLHVLEIAFERVELVERAGQAGELLVEHVLRALLKIAGHDAELS